MILRGGRERFEDKFVPEPNTGCWLWVGKSDRKGYGRYWSNGKFVMAHRYSYEDAGGVIPDELVLDHLCRTPCCVNPDHLEPVTNAENIRRGEHSAVLRAKAEARTHCKKGHLLSPDNLKAAGVKQCRACKHESDRQYKARKRTASAA